MGQLLGKIDVEVPAHEVLPGPPGGGFYELRKYPPAVAVETPHRADTDGRDDDGSSSFGRLARYIGVFGTPQNTKAGGEGAEVIAMTAPVVTTSGAEKVAMTAPVVTAGGSGGGIMQFLLPSKFTMETAPKPTDPQVSLRQIPARTLAVHTFSGWTSPAYAKQKEAALLEALEKDKVQVCGEPYLLRYNPPWTLGPLRRNEVVVAVKVDEQAEGAAANAPPATS